MNKTIATILAIGTTLFLLFGGIFIADKLEPAEEVIEPVLGEELKEIIKPIDPIVPVGLIKLPNNVPYKELNKIQQNTLIGQLKGKTLRNGKQIPNSLTEEENDILMEAIANKYEGVQIKDLPPEAFDVNNGELKLKLEYLISNL